jgi:hypothetical protein
MKTTIDMAREAGLQSEHGVSEFAYIDRLQHFEVLVRADERNRTWTQEHWTEYERSIAAAEREACLHAATVAISLCDDPVAAIRARGNT